LFRGIMEELKDKTTETKGKVVKAFGNLT